MNDNFDFKKSTQVINFFAKKEQGTIDILKLMKLVWIADRCHLREYGRPILNDEYFAMKRGPVPSATKDIASDTEWAQDKQKYYSKYIKKLSRYSVASIRNVDSEQLSESEIECLDKAYDNFGQYKPSQLTKISHDFPEWKKFEKSLESGTKNEQIDYMDFFKDIRTELYKQMFSESQDKLNSSKEIFLEDTKISTALA